MTKREFPYNATRIGDQAVKLFHPVQCCRCGREKVFESFKALPDQVIAKRFGQWGWVLGRNRQNDICPTCIGIAPENRLADRFKVTKDDQPVPTVAEVVQKAEEKRATLEKSVQNGLLKMNVYRDLSEDLRHMRIAIEQIAEAMQKMAEEKKAPVKKTRARKKSEAVS